MKKIKYLDRIIALGGSALLIALDQFFKYLAVIYLYPIETKPIWKGVFQLTYIENPGAAFGIFAGKTFLLVGLTGLIILLLIILTALGKFKHPLLLTSISLVIGGGIGNLIDRIISGYVIDYFHFTLFEFPVFNFADCCVVIGTGLLIVYFLFFDKNSDVKKEKKPLQEETV